MPNIDKSNTQKLGIFGAAKSESKVDFARVEREAKEILDKFAKALEKVEKEAGKEESYPEQKKKFCSGYSNFQEFEYIDREGFEREENQGNPCEQGFKKRILDNAPNHDDDFVIGEKGGWK